MEGVEYPQGKLVKLISVENAVTIFVHLKELLSSSLELFLGLRRSIFGDHNSDLLLFFYVANGFGIFRLLWLSLVSSRVDDSLLDALLLVGWKELSRGLSGKLLFLFYLLMVN